MNCCQLSGFDYAVTPVTAVVSTPIYFPSASSISMSLPSIVS